MSEDQTPVESNGDGAFVPWRPFDGSPSSGADQSASEADRQISADDQAASDDDQLTADLDQAASDREQAAADRRHDSAVDLTAADELAYEASRKERSSASTNRQQNRLRRAGTARLRSATAALRDRILRPRLRAAAVQKRLMTEGVSRELAERWCDAWEVEAARRGLSPDSQFWSLGTHWIWTERAAGRAPFEDQVLVST